MSAFHRAIEEAYRLHKGYFNQVGFRVRVMRLHGAYGFQ